MRESPGLQLRALRAVGATALSARGQEFYGLLVNEYEPVDFGHGSINSNTPFIVCRTVDVERIGISKDDVISGLPEQYRVKQTDNGDKSQIVNGQWAGFHVLWLRK